MFKIESYVTPILLSYVDKYVRDFKPADAQVSLWGGGVALHNLVLKADVLQQEVALPFTLVSGRIHELLIQVPWTKIMSEPIIVTIDTIECVLSLHPPTPSSNEGPPAESPSPKTQVVEAPPGYMQALVRRIVSNIALRVHHLIVKYVQDDIVMSLNVKHLAVDSAGVDWEPAFADIDQTLPVIRRLVRLDDLTLCLDKADSDGKIRFYQEPLLYRCQLDFRVLTKLVSANTRRASNLSIQLRSSKLAWGVTSDQLTLLLRLMRERPAFDTKTPPPIQKVASTVQATPLHVSSANSAEPVRTESWSEWAWSWLPTWIDREGVEEAPMPPTPTPIYFAAYFDCVSLVFKVMELEGAGKKRGRGVLELSASHAAVQTSMCSPITLRIRFGVRSLTLSSTGKCVCGHLGFSAANDQPSVYLRKTKKDDSEEPWEWPEEDFNDVKVETAEVIDEEFRSSPGFNRFQANEESKSSYPEEKEKEEGATSEHSETCEAIDDLWHKMAPFIYMEYNHERSPSNAFTNPYENPPKDFQYSDWVEECNLKINLAPMELMFCMGLLHRLTALKSIYLDLPPVPEPDPAMRVLTVEECDALSDNLPQRRISIEAVGTRARLVPWDHSLADKAAQPPLVLDLELPKTTLLINGPLYPHRVCSAACQIPDDVGPLWQGARLHVSAAIKTIQAKICSPSDEQPRPCARADLRFVIHVLLHKEYFTKRETVVFSYSLKIREGNMCGSAARLQSAYHVPVSLLKDQMSVVLRHTTLAKDALNDEEAAAVDFTFEDLSLRGYMTDNINTHIITLHSMRATAFHEPKGGELQQAWLFSGPDTPTTSPYLRMAVQWCKNQTPNSLDYVGLWMEATAFCVDPLFIAWLAYSPQIKLIAESQTHLPTSKNMSSTQYFMRRRATPPSSSGRGVSRSGSASGAELVHVRTRSIGSSSEPSEKKDPKQVPQPSKPSSPKWTEEDYSGMYKRVRAMLINVEVGLILVYVTMSTASALDCATVRDAMERHASASQSVITFGLGQLTVNSSTATQHLWHEIRHDGPTTLTTIPEKEIDSFPWKLRLADVSCYTLEVRLIPESYGEEKSRSGLRSQLKISCEAAPRTVLEMVTTSVTVSVVTKTQQIKTVQKQEPRKRAHQNVKEERLKYFETGTDFKPSTLKEFVRGPAKRNASTVTEEPEVKTDNEPKFTFTTGPVVSLGVNVHADTPPIIVKLDQDQIHMVAAALHCFKHILTLLRRSSVTLPKHGFTTTGASSRSLIRSVSEFEEIHTPTEVSPSETRSELISIFDAHATNELKVKLKTFFWFQWVVSHAALVVATHQVKLTFDVDDIISTVDIQTHYNQLKIKLTSASVRHFERNGSEDWTPGVLAGRVLEVREPTNAKEENNFLALTITQAQISTLPTSWKEELHPKVLEHKDNVDSMWEIYATLAPLEAVLQPNIVENIMSLVREMAPRSLCPLQEENSPSAATWQWPFCYVTAGGLRLLLTTEEPRRDTSDDTFMLVIGKVTLNPHPENPIFRRIVNVNTESSWLPASGGFEGRQYEVLVSNLAIRSAQFDQLVSQESSEAESMNGTGSENPALKWTQPTILPVITPILHAVDVGCVLAPAVYIGGALVNGPAVELNILSDCAIEINFGQIGLMRRMISDLSEFDNASGMLFDEEQHGVCPYATLLMKTEREEQPYVSDTTLTEELEIPSVSRRNFTADSGVETVTSHSTFKLKGNVDEINIKKSLSVAFVEQTVDASEYLEVYITMGTIELSLYTVDDNRPEVIALRTPQVARETIPDSAKVPVVQGPVDELKAPVKEPHQKEHHSMAGSISLTETVRGADLGRTNFDILRVMPQARRSEGCIPLIHVTFNQPNLYYWKRRNQKTVQVSVFNAWLGLGVGQIEGHWHAVLLSTARGVPDPVTDIPPALATMKLIIPVPAVTPHASSATVIGSRGTIQLDVERPVMIEVCSDRIRRLKGIYELLQTELSDGKRKLDLPGHKVPILYKLRRTLVHHQMESVTIQMSQIGVSGTEGTIGWDGGSLQIAAGSRPDRLIVRGLVTSLLVAAGPPGDRRQVLLQPLMLGFESEAIWELWRRAEGGPAAREPMVRVNLELDRVTIDLRPAELLTLSRIMQVIQEFVGTSENIPTPESVSDSMLRYPTSSRTIFTERHSTSSADVIDSSEHYYRDDLRSGAFKIVSGGQLPMAYQVMLFGSSVSWRYPHPRSITRVVAFPLPGQDTEIDCVLEVYVPMLSRWETHTKFKLPVGEPRELQLYVVPPDAVFAVMWRFRVCSPSDDNVLPFKFDIQKFMSRIDPLASDPQPEYHPPVCSQGVTAEQLSGVLRVDSYFAPRLLPRTRLALRLSAFEIHAHNALPAISSQATSLEGYYVSKPLMRSHRVLCVSARNTTAYAQLGSPAGVMMLVDSYLSSDILDCAMGTMEQLVDEFRTQAILSLPGAMTENLKTRMVASSIHVALHVPRLRTLHALAVDWITAMDQCKRESTDVATVSPKIKTKRELAAATAIALEGRVSLWIHNTCVAALRVGQDGTDEVVPLGPGARLAYRWRSPTSEKKLRMAFAGPSAEWHWSKSIPFTAGTTRVRLEDAESLGSSKNVPGAGVYLYVKVEETGSRRYMHIFGRLALANMLRLNLVYKVRARCSESSQWKTVCSGELHPETVGESVVCGAECEMVLKIKFVSVDGWSGDIPLRECPKENVPWLVKVPSDGEYVPYVSVWCRVVRARSDGRILATIWPLYVLHSHLPLDTDVLIATEPGTSVPDMPTLGKEQTPLIQTAPGRGSSTHLLAPGTTSARHNLSFQYRNIECPVTKEAVPLHYGVTDTSVFDKRSTVSHIDEVIAEIFTWLERSSRNATSNWPYSVVAKHWDGVWQPALLQPRCDVTVRYRAVRAGGGCCLEMQLCPIVLLCNATPIPLTLRAHDAAPLCKLEPGTSISPPSAVLKKPFFISVEKGRETFVSGELAVSEVDPGRYGAPPPGRVALDHAANFAIQCNQKVALLTMYYEIKEEINVIGVSSTYVLLNRLDTDLLVSTMAVPTEQDQDSLLRPKTYKVVPPTKKEAVNGTALCHFFLRGRWRGSSPSELRAFLCLALPSGAHPPQLPVPVLLGHSPVRRALALIDENRQSVPVVVMQMKQESRWLIIVARDPCPQFLVSNHTRIPLNIAQPVHQTDEPSTSSVAVKQECNKAKWWCAVYPDCMTHYSSPAYCERYPPPQSVVMNPTIPFLTFAKVKDDGEPQWCPPVAVADGEQLLQISNEVTVKLRVRTYPHSTHLELQDVDQNDISASDIRRRLIGISEDSISSDVIDNVKLKKSCGSLERLQAHDHLAVTKKSSQLESILLTNESSIEDLSISKLKMPNASFTEDKQSLAGIPHSHNDGSTLIIFNEEFHAMYDGDDGPKQKGVDIESMFSFSAPDDSQLGAVEGMRWLASEKLRCVIASVVIEMGSSTDSVPLLALHVDRAAVLVIADTKKTKTIVSIADVQIDNLQYESGQYDFAVVATTRAEPLATEPWPPFWNMFAERTTFATRQDNARLLLRLQHDKWTVVHYTYKELSEVDISVGPLALYVEDAYVKALVELFRQAAPAGEAAHSIADERALQAPLRLRVLHVHPLDLTLTLHTAVRMYIALDQSPLRLSAFKLQDMMTSVERLTHALTVHYLSAAILGAGWVVGGLELLGAPGALAARVGGATGGVRGVASAAAAALLRSLSAWAGSLARNLDLLAGDEEHARRAAAARRRPPPSLVAGLITGITNFAINILGAVGGLAHHPLVGVAVGETESGAAALRRGLIGALTKPLSATADLVAYAGHGLLTQTGWDPVPQPRKAWGGGEARAAGGWRRDCVRWTFRLADLTALSGFEVLLDNAPLQLLLTHKFLVVAEPETERIVEMIDLRFCTLGSFQGQIIELCVTQKRQAKATDSRAVDEDDEYQISVAAMARVARYTGAGGAGGAGAAGAGGAGEARVLALLPAPGRSHALHAALAAALHHIADTHFSLL